MPHTFRDELEKGMTRAWINQPSELQRYHKYHGQNVITCPPTQGDGNAVQVAFVDGSETSMYIPITALSEGWNEHKTEVERKSNMKEKGEFKSPVHERLEFLKEHKLKLYIRQLPAPPIEIEDARIKTIKQVMTSSGDEVFDVEFETLRKVNLIIIGITDANMDNMGWISCNYNWGAARVNIKPKNVNWKRYMDKFINVSEILSAAIRLRVGTAKRSMYGCDWYEGILADAEHEIDDILKRSFNESFEGYTEEHRDDLA